MVAERNIFTKMFETSTVFFTGIPLLVAYGSIAYAIGLGPKRHINKNLVLALLTFGFASLTVHVVNDLNHDDKESIQTAGFVGYGMVIAVLLIVFALSYIAALKKSKQPGA